MAYIFLIFILLIQAILLLAHWFLYKTIVRFLGITDPTMILALRWIVGVLSVIFVLASLVAFRYYNVFTKILYTIAASWLGIFYFLLIGSVLAWLSLLLPVNHKLTAEVLLVLGLVAGFYSLANAGNVRVTTLEIKLPNLPNSWQDKTAVWVSDTHFGQVRNLGFARKLTDQISNLHPDIVFIGGDLFDGSVVNIDALARQFSNLKAPQGTYFITGNHEEFGDNTKYLDAIRNNGIKVLDNEMVILDGLQVIGVDYHDSANLQRYQKIMESITVDPNKPSILLKHEPNNLAVAEQKGVSLQISGHTHRAQIWPFVYIARTYYKGYDYGLKTFGKLMVYTSSGAGTWGPPMRFLTYPEIVQIKFK